MESAKTTGTSSLCMQVYFHNICHPSLHPVLTHFVTNPAFLAVLNMKDKYGIYLHFLVLLMGLTPLHMTLLWRPHRETEQIIPLINVSHESEQIIQNQESFLISVQQ